MKLLQCDKLHGEFYFEIFDTFEDTFPGVSVTFEQFLGIIKRSPCQITLSICIGRGWDPGQLLRIFETTCETSSIRKLFLGSCIGYHLDGFPQGFPITPIYLLSVLPKKQVQELCIDKVPLDDVLPALTEAMRENHAIFSFNRDDDIKWDFEYYMQLNWGGRRALKDTNLAKALWPLVLGRPSKLKHPFEHNPEADVIYHLLCNGVNQIFLS